MKNLVIISAIASLLFTACQTNKLASYNDDAYSNPSDEKRLAKIAAEQRAKKDAENKQKQEGERMVQQAKDDANPLYKEPSSNADDYYDYKYASRVRRFNQPISGAGYYDNYYTNQYHYNQNPSSYGTSIYSTYGSMPSNQFNNYSSGLSMSFGNGYSPYGYNNYNSNYYGNNYGYNNNNSYNPYGYTNYNSYGYSNYGNNYGYSPYGYSNYYGNNYGYGNGYNNNYYGNSNSGWGYLNGHDPNSNYTAMYNGPRGTNGGTNGGRITSAGMTVPEDLQYNAKREFVEQVVKQQETTPRFTEVVKPNRINNEYPSNFNNGSINTSGQTNNTPRSQNAQNGNIDNNGASTQQNSTSNTPRSKGGFLSGFFNNNTTTTNTNTTPRTSGTTRIGGKETNVNTNNSSEKTSNQNQGWNNYPSNSGTSNSGSSGGNTGGSSPRGGGSGGGGRP